MSPPLDKRLLWHPRQDNKFVVGGSTQITLYEWAAEYPEIRRITSQHDLHFMKCFAWSPDPHIDDLMAIGTTGGKVDLIRLESSKFSRQHNILASGPTASLPVQKARACNALAFSSANPSYLAVGLEKVRGENSLAIWDISTTMPLLTLPPYAAGRPSHSTVQQNQHLRSPYLSSGPSSPNPPFKPLQLPRLDAVNNPRLDSRILQQHAPTEFVNAMSFLPHTTHLLLAGLSSRWLRLFDLRSATNQSQQQPSAMQVAVKAQSIVADPFDWWRVGTSADGVIMAWDVRKLREPVLSWTERDAGADGAVIRNAPTAGSGGTMAAGGILMGQGAGGGAGGMGVGAASSTANQLVPSSYTTIEFSSTRRGTLATHQKDDHYVRFWDLIYSSETDIVGSGNANMGGDGLDYIKSQIANLSGGAGSAAATKTAPKKGWAGLPWSSGGASATPASHSPKEPDGFPVSSMVLAGTRRTRYFDNPLVSFTLVPSPSKRPLTSNVMVVNRAGDLELYAVHDTPKQAVWNSAGDFLYGAGRGLRVVEGCEKRQMFDEGAADPRGHGTANGRGGGGEEQEPWGLESLDLELASKFGPERDHSHPRGAGQRRQKEKEKERERERGRPKHSHQYQHSDEEGRKHSRHDQYHRQSSHKNHDADKRAASSSRKRRSENNGWRAFVGVVEGDISMVMRNRAILGYGLSKPEDNVYFTESNDPEDSPSHALSDIWDWIYQTQELLTCRIHGYDFSFQGLLGIWEGFHPIAQSTYHTQSQVPQPAGQKQHPDSALAALTNPNLGFLDAHYNTQFSAHQPSSSLPHPIPINSNWSGGSGSGGGTASRDHQTLAPHPVGIQRTTSNKASASTPSGGGLDRSGPGSGSGSGGGAPITHPPLMPPAPKHQPHRSPSPTDEFYGNFGAALETLAYRCGIDKASIASAGYYASGGVGALATGTGGITTGMGGLSAMATTQWKPGVPTMKALQRQVALKLLGWGFREEEMNGDIERWKKEGKQSRAACWLVFTRRYGEAVKLLMQSHDETHKMMSGTVAALIPNTTGSSPNRSTEFREHCERIIVWLQDPYFRAMLTHLALGDWTEVLDEEMLPFQERLAIALQFLDDKALSSYLRRLAERAVAEGDIQALVVTGMTSRQGVDLIQGYVDRTGDVQSAALLGALALVPVGEAVNVGLSTGGGGGYSNQSNGGGGVPFRDRRVERWLESYRDLLDGFKLHHHRVGFDIERGQRVQDVLLQNADFLPQFGLPGSGGGGGEAGAGPGDWVKRQILIKCKYCSKAVNSTGGLGKQKGQATSCPHCGRALPRCSVCLMTLGIIQDAPRESELIQYPSFKDTMDEAIVICQTCRHGGHASHILEWFFDQEGARSHGVCPVADCECRCADEF